ncbi:MAG: hypothetical protein R2762_04190 [Bryobacteraceae bacterium]
MEDKAGDEEVYLRAQKDMNVDVLNDQSITVGRQRQVLVRKKDDLLTVSEGNRAIEVSANAKPTRAPGRSGDGNKETQRRRLHRPGEGYIHAARRRQSS